METRRCYTINNEEIIQKLHIWKQAEDKGLTELLTSSNLLCGKLLCVGKREKESRVLADEEQVVMGRRCHPFLRDLPLWTCLELVSYLLE